MELTDDLIDGALDSITGFIIAKAAKEHHQSVAQMMETFLLSNTGQLLADKNTGLYWDNVFETYDMFVKEMKVVK
jgi:hypothetical protein